MPEAEAADLMARKNAYYLDSIATMSPADILPGALELLDAARARGLRLALGSGSRNARAVLDRLGIADRFDAICDGYSAAVGKPAPDLFLAAAAQLDLAPETCVVFEDAADGISAAHAAGMLAVGIGPEDRIGEADLVLPEGLADETLAGSSPHSPTTGRSPRSRPGPSSRRSYRQPGLEISRESETGRA